MADSKGQTRPHDEGSFDWTLVRREKERKKRRLLGAGSDGEPGYFYDSITRALHHRTAHGMAPVGRGPLQRLRPLHTRALHFFAAQTPPLACSAPRRRLDGARRSSVLTHPVPARGNATWHLAHLMYYYRCTLSMLQCFDGAGLTSSIQATSPAPRLPVCQTNATRLPGCPAAHSFALRGWSSLRLRLAPTEQIPPGPRRRWWMDGWMDHGWR